MSGLRITAENLQKTYAVGPGQALQALGDVGFEVAAGQMVALMGPSGSGKSTLLHIVGAMDDADGGTVTVGETRVDALSRKRQAAYRRSVGFVFQRFHLLPALTVLDNVIAPVLPFRTDFDKRDRALRLLEAVGIEDKANTVPARLSGGQQQRVAIARALVNDPGLLLADEPTGNLDSATGEGIMDLLVDLNRERGMTVLVATHDPVVAGRCHRTLALRDGRLVESPNGIPKSKRTSTRTDAMKSKQRREVSEE